MPRKLIVFGNGGIGELAQYYFTNDSSYEVVAFAADGERITDSTFSGLPLVPFETVERDYPPGEFSMFIALSYDKLNRIRQQKFEAAKSKGYEPASYVSSRLVSWENDALGENCLILENQTIQPFCTIGDNVTLWSGNHIGHHSTIGDHCFLASHIVVSGYCRIGQRCFIGVNASLRDNCDIGDDCFIGMNAAITANMPKGSVALGTGSDVLAPDDRRARALKRSYFNL